MLDALGRAGGPGRRIAPRIDLVRSTGLRYAVDRGREQYASSRLHDDGRRPGYVDLWRDAAAAVGAEAADLGRGFVELRSGAARAMVWNHWVPLDDVVALQLSLEKPLVHERLAAAGLPIPEYAAFDAADLSPALAFLSRSELPCVVKPVAMAGGTMTTSGIRTPEHLRRARLRARRSAARLMIEGQVPGDNYRFLLLDGELLDVIRRCPPRVTGDGRSTIRELIAAENRRRFSAAGGRRPWLLTADLDAILTLEAAGLGLGSVPASGASVTVKTVVNANAPEENESVRHDVADELVAEAARAAALLGVRLAGVDVITPDRRRGLQEGGGVVLEVNATPGLHYHYEVGNPERRAAVMVPIVRRLLATVPEPAA